MRRNCAVLYAIQEDKSFDCPYSYEGPVTTLTAPNAAIAVQRISLQFVGMVCSRSFTIRLVTGQQGMDIHSTVSAAREAATGYTQDIVMSPRSGMCGMSGMSGVDGAKSM